MPSNWSTIQFSLVKVEKDWKSFLITGKIHVCVAFQNEKILTIRAVKSHLTLWETWILGRDKDIAL